jgi:hypothetical protein
MLILSVKEGICLYIDAKRKVSYGCAAVTVHRECGFNGLKYREATLPYKRIDNTTRALWSCKRPHRAAITLLVHKFCIRNMTPFRPAVAEAAACHGYHTHCPFKTAAS